MNSLVSEPAVKADEISSIWNEVLELDKANDKADFFESGGHSLKTMMFVSKVENQLGISIPLSALVQNSTLSGLLSYITENPEKTTESVEPFSIDGTETQIEYLLKYNDEEKQAKRTELYELYYAEALKSQSHAEFCKQVYGENYGQHGMADFTQIDSMLAKLDPKPGETILDVGCGYGLISRYMAEKTGAKVVGIDLASSAINTAVENSRDMKGQLEFKQMDLQDIRFNAGSFDHVVSIDTIYFTRDQRSTITKFKEILKDNGKVAIFRTFPIRSFTAETWSPDITELATILNDLFDKPYIIDFCTEENAHWGNKVTVLESLKQDFIEEGYENLYNFRFDEAKYEASIEQFRYLFVSHK